jgi:hypothetical protein
LLPANAQTIEALKTIPAISPNATPAAVPTHARRHPLPREGMEAICADCRSIHTASAHWFNPVSKLMKST